MPMPMPTLTLTEKAERIYSRHENIVDGVIHVAGITLACGGGVTSKSH